MIKTIVKVRGSTNGISNKDLRIKGRIIGFDKNINLVLDDAEKVNIKKKSRKSLRMILFKEDNITLVMNTSIMT
uniref:Sm protein E n=1 Tax=Populus trichocarpa TaxID=3694 RepID=A0A2K2C7J0_POPTR